MREINERFRKLSLKYHPDKDGDEEDFYKLQASMAVKRFQRENCDRLSNFFNCLKMFARNYSSS